MEEVVHTRLKMLIENVESLIDTGQEVLRNLKDKTVEYEGDEAQMISAKLKASIDRFVNEMYNYYKLVEKASVDDLSRYTATQIKGEELVTELDFAIKRRITEPQTQRHLNIEDKMETSNVASKLPKMELAKFNGDVLKWHSFWDQFSSNVDSRNINDVDKLLYLQSVLEGEAKRAMEGLETTNKNYEIAVSTLKNRYGKPDIIINAHYTALDAIKTADNTVSDCRRAFNEIERHLRVLSSLGEDVNHNHLRVTIKKRFPKDLIYELRVQMGKEKETVDNIRLHLEQIISAREESHRITEVNDYEQPSTSKVDDAKFTTEALHIGTETTREQRPLFRKNFSSFRKEGKGSYKKSFNKRTDDNKRQSDCKDSKLGQKRQYRNDKSRERREPESKRAKPTCIFCGNGHFNDECRSVETIPDRKKKLEGRCYNCFAKGHKMADCRSHMQCRHCGKFGEHNRALCPSKELVKTDSLHVRNSSSGNTGVTILQTAVVSVNPLEFPNKTEACRILLDCGSQRTYITKGLANKLRLPELERNNLSVFTFGTDRPKEIESPLVKFEIVTRTKERATVHANVVPHITNSISTLSYSPSDAQAETITKDMVFADDNSLGERVDVLIGNDYYFSFINGEKIQVTDNLYLVNSSFGWVWSGNCTRSLNVSKSELSMSVLTYVNSEIDCSAFSEPDLPLRSDNLKRLWDLESIGITDSPKVSRDDEAIKHFNETTQFLDNRYHVKWPWIEYPPTLPSNFGLAFGRLNSLLKRLEDDTIQSYDMIIKDQLEKGIIEIIENPSTSVEHPVHYLPHHCINQGNKLRLVYDASAKSKDNRSLNECLYRGPLMLEDLTGLLIRFREHRIGIVADVEKAFLQIGLQNEDRDVTRFLWPMNVAQAVSSQNLLHLRFQRVPFGVISSPFLLNATIRYHLRKGNDTIRKQIADDLYVDNLVTGTNSLKSALSLYHTSKCAFDDLSMNLREWNSNSIQFMNAVPARYRNKETEHIKVLGLNWDLKRDRMSLRFNLSERDTRQVDTKREVLRIIASVFDPCGFAAPLVLPTKLFLQDLWRQKLDWDTKLGQENLQQSKIALDGLKFIADISVPRCFVEGLDETEIVHELHAFTDASMQAYAAALYLRSTTDKDITVNFMIGKSRLVGKDKQTDLQIPKLELLGALIGSRLMQTVLKFLKFKVRRLVLWTDSKIVIDWCNSEKLLPPFVAKRVEEIKQNPNLSIRHVPSELNPADLATRPDASLWNIQRWLKGPDFLYHTSDKWPQNVPDQSENCALVCNASGGQGPSEKHQETQQSESDLQQEKDDMTQQLSQLENLDLMHDIRRVQIECFSKELHGTQTDLMRSLRVYKDEDGLLRCGGRLDNTDWSTEQKHPILLPKCHELTDKIINEIHRKNFHVGVSHTLSLIRRKYWIPHGRRHVQKVLKRCDVCRKYSGGPFKLPPMAQLPAERVKYSNPFTYVGVDYFGPLIVNINGVTEKRWVSLYTCLATRAIHMEVVADAAAEECLLALRRFISARGVPKLIISDNALQFKLTADVLTSEYCITNEIKWKFNPELAPWYGGYYERLIGIVKNCLKKTVDKHLLNHNQLCTLIKEIESVVNSRPLTVVGEEIEHVLTPEDFLRPGGPSLPESSDKEFIEPATLTKTNLIDGWKRGQTVLREYVEMFVNQYLTSLRDRRGIHRQPRIVVDRDPKVGELVQVKGSANRALWKVGRISSVVKGADGKIRVAKVITSPNETLTRSISHLYPLELDDEYETTEQLQSCPMEVDRPHTYDLTQLPSQIDDQQTNNAQATHVEADRRPATPRKEESQLRTKRASAQKAREKLKEWTAQLYCALSLDTIDY